MADLAKVIADEPAVKWIIGRVKTVTGDTFTMTYNGGDVTNVGTLDHYIPVVGDVVHVLSSDMNGMVAVGSNNQTTTPPTVPTPRAPVTVASTAVATYSVPLATWLPGALNGAPDQIGCWFYPGMATTPGVGIQPVAALSIQITAQDATPLEFVLHNLAGPTGAPVITGSYRVAAPAVLTPTAVRLPLEWATLLISGQALGVGIGGGDYTAILIGSSGLLTFTPLT
jgi:hypothetical protein